jgi:hypothetical protein
VLSDQPGVTLETAAFPGVVVRLTYRTRLADWIWLAEIPPGSVARLNSTRAVAPPSTFIVGRVPKFPVGFAVVM